MKRSGAGSEKPLLIGVLGFLMLGTLFALAYFTGAMATKTNPTAPPPVAAHPRDGG
jgi:hypothetical protein